MKQFAAAAQSYNAPIILIPLDEMNLNEEAWGYGTNNNTADGFRAAWIHIHNLFNGINNVKFAIDFNNVSIPNIPGNQFSDYYPGSDYVDYVGIDGFNFANPWQTFGQVFDTAVHQVQSFNKPMYIFSTASYPGTAEANWITEGLGTHIKNYTNMRGWIWFNQNGADGDWVVNSSPATLAAFKSVVAGL